MRAWKHPATIIASLALFVALGGGTALASGLSDLISGKKIANHSIAVQKLTAGAINALRGHAYIAAPDFQTGVTPLPVDKNWVTVKSLTLPAGSYVVFGKSQLKTSSAPDASCALDEETSEIGKVIDEDFLGPPSSGSSGHETLSLAATVHSRIDSIKITLDCRSWQPNAAAYDANIVAIKVGSVTGS
jgi:hypothetical protein